jgi:hypothetical protein
MAKELSILLGTDRKVKGKFKEKIVPVLNHTTKTYCGNGVIAPRVFNLGTRLR